MARSHTLNGVVQTITLSMTLLLSSTVFSQISEDKAQLSVFMRQVSEFLDVRFEQIPHQIPSVSNGNDPQDVVSFEEGLKFWFDVLNGLQKIAVTDNQGSTVEFSFQHLTHPKLNILNPLPRSQTRLIKGHGVPIGPPIQSSVRYERLSSSHVSVMSPNLFYVLDVWFDKTSVSGGREWHEYENFGAFLKKYEIRQTARIGISKAELLNPSI